jgi:hypothetical protein
VVGSNCKSENNRKRQCYLQSMSPIEVLLVMFVVDRVSQAIFQLRLQDISERTV